MCGGKDNSWKLVLSFCYVSPGVKHRLSGLVADTFIHWNQPLFNCFFLFLKMYLFFIYLSVLLRIGQITSRSRWAAGLTVTLTQVCSWTPTPRSWQLNVVLHVRRVRALLKLVLLGSGWRSCHPAVVKAAQAALSARQHQCCMLRKVPEQDEGWGFQVPILKN